MVSVAKPLLIWGYHGLTIVTIVFGFTVKPSFLFVMVVCPSTLETYSIITFPIALTPRHRVKFPQRECLGLCT